MMGLVAASNLPGGGWSVQPTASRQRALGGADGAAEPAELPGAAVDSAGEVPRGEAAPEPGFCLKPRPGVGTHCTNTVPTLCQHCTIAVPTLCQHCSNTVPTLYQHGVGW